MNKTKPYAVNQLPTELLREMLRQYNTDKTVLTIAEQELCRRIAHCCHCGNIWVMHRDKRPRRCEGCKRTGWDMPLLSRMVLASQGIDFAPTKGG